MDKRTTILLNSDGHYPGKYHVVQYNKKTGKTRKVTTVTNPTEGFVETIKSENKASKDIQVYLCVEDGYCIEFKPTE